MPRELAEMLDPDVTAQRIVDSVRTLLGATGSALFRPKTDSGDLVAVAIAGDWEPALGGSLVVPQGTGLLGLAVRERALLATCDVPTHPVSR